MYAELAIQSAQASMVSIAEKDKESQEQFMTHGITQEEEKKDES